MPPTKVNMPDNPAYLIGISAVNANNNSQGKKHILIRNAIINSMSLSPFFIAVLFYRTVMHQ